LDEILSDLPPGWLLEEVRHIHGCDGYELGEEVGLPNQEFNLVDGHVPPFSAIGGVFNGGLSELGARTRARRLYDRWIRTERCL
jgi:hypothetical protein